MTLMLIDGNNLLSRAAFAAKANRSNMSVGDTSTAALHIFATMVSKYVRLIGPSKVAVMWDDGHSMRDEIYPAYKANRFKRVDDGDHDHFLLAKQFLHHVGVHQCSLYGWEADDLIAAAARQSPTRVAIVSGDKDLMQLISPAYSASGIDLPEIVQYRVPDDEPWTYQRYSEKYGYRPSQAAMMMALVGDTSDGVPGLKGVGPVKAVKMLEEHRWQWEALMDTLGPERAAEARLMHSLVDLRDIEYPADLWGPLEDGQIPPWHPVDINHDGLPLSETERAIGLQHFLDRWQLSTIKDRLVHGTFWSEPISTAPVQTGLMDDLNY